MSVFYLYEEQEGGCDYTIGCGRRLRQLEGVADMVEAVKKASNLNTDCRGDDDPMIITHGEFAVSHARILEVANERVIELCRLGAERDQVYAEREGKEREEKRKGVQRIGLAPHGGNENHGGIKQKRCRRDKTFL